ncbi:Mov34-domain-containing protein [Melanogaster broomeanus]|nr:Mov34-domain-containing protein [Melanogaster broomeanus]
MPLGPTSSASSSKIHPRLEMLSIRKSPLPTYPISALTSPHLVPPSPRPTSLAIHPTALLSILDHFLRRTDTQHRVIGTLLGTRTTSSSSSSSSASTVINVTHSFAVLHSETEEQVAVDMDYHRAMYEMFLRGRGESASSAGGAAPQGKEALSIVGWYATGSSESGQGGLGTFSALIQNFYEQETAPFPAVHVALDTGTEEGVGAGVRAYVSSPVGVYPTAENCLFVPIPCELKFHESERAGRKSPPSAPFSQSLMPPPLQTPHPTSPLPALHTALLNTSTALNRVLSHVQSILRGEVAPDPALGRYLAWTTAMQDGVMVGYLANLVRGQAEVAGRLALAGGA